ncbi:MAG: hypothetical protein ABGY09_06090 [Euryarchaeota archaeon]
MTGDPAAARATGRDPWNEIDRVRPPRRPEVSPTRWERLATACTARASVVTALAMVR